MSFQRYDFNNFIIKVKTKNYIQKNFIKLKTPRHTHIYTTNTQTTYIFLKKSKLKFKNYLNHASCNLTRRN